MWVSELALFSVVFNMVIMKTKQVCYISCKSLVAKKTSGNPCYEQPHYGACLHKSVLMLTSTSDLSITSENICESCWQHLKDPTSAHSSCLTLLSLVFLPVWIPPFAVGQHLFSRVLLRVCTAPLAVSPAEGERGGYGRRVSDWQEEDDSHLCSWGKQAGQEGS